MHGNTRPLALRIRRHIRYAPESGCWLWTGGMARGAPVLKMTETDADGRKRVRKRRARRLAWTLCVGPLAQMQDVRPSCSEPLCIRPAHMTAEPHGSDWLPGSAQETRLERGEKHPLARLTENDVRAIRTRHALGESQSALARRYGVHRNTIDLAVRRETWKHVA